MLWDTWSGVDLVHPFSAGTGRYVRLDEDRLLIGRYLFFWVWERRCVFRAFRCSAPNVCGLACRRQ